MTMQQFIKQWRMASGRPILYIKHITAMMAIDVAIVAKYLNPNKSRENGEGSGGAGVVVVDGTWSY